MVEWTICTSVLPLLDPFVLFHVDERVRYLLPKSLAGRIPRTALQWGCRYYYYYYYNSKYSASFECDKNNSSSSSTTNSSSSSNNNNNQRAYELQRTASVLEKLILLDRFRPMLLPRHVADLYAAMLQAEALTGGGGGGRRRRQDSSSSEEETTILSSLLLSLDNDDDYYYSHTIVDPVLQAKAYQTLLLQGTQVPVWLRKRVSQLLMKLATKQDLLAVIQVFVHAAPNKDRTAAGLRLALALKSGINNNNNNNDRSNDDGKGEEYVHCLCQQVLGILQGIWNEHGSLQALLESPNSSQKEATIHTLWAILDIIPPSVRDLFFERWVSHRVMNNPRNNNNNKSTSDIYQTVGLFGTLLSTVPPVSDTSFVLRMTLCPLLVDLKEVATDGLPTTLLGLWLRLTAMVCVTRSQMKEDTILLLRLVVKTLVESKPMKDDFGNVIKGVDLAAISLLFALGPCQWDLTPLRFQRAIGESEEESVRAEKILDDRPLVEVVVHEMEQRSQILSKVIFPSPDFDDNSAIQKLPSLLFAVMLRLYFSSDSDNETEPKLPELLRSSHFQLLPLICLPVMCEENQATLLLSADSERDGLLEMMGLVFQATAKLVVIQEDALATPQTSIKNSFAFCKRIDLAADFVSKLVGNIQLRTQTLSDDFGARSGNEDVLFSISSALLGILISILELGAKKRSQRDEEAFRSFVPFLRRLAELSAKVPTEDWPLTESALSEFAEMASHANALIASRAVVEVEMESDQKPTTREEMLAQAQEDLKSKDPPIRARGVVQLRHLAMAATGETAGFVTLVQPIASDSILQRLLIMSLEALGDKESYVYLAAIHTIVAIADASSSEIVPLLGRILATSRFAFSSGPDIILNNEQRIKLAEALIFAVRRSCSIYEFIPFLLECMLFGPGNNKALVSPDAKEANLIQRHTHEYFMKDKGDDKEDNEEKDMNKKWEERDIRVKAGGPLFETEEDDAVRASQLNVVAELLSISDPSVLSRFTRFILDASVNALRLDTSRPVRRAGAYVARQLYSALLREEAALNPDNADLSYAISLADGGEEMLRAILLRCCTAEDLNDLGEAMHRAYDPATVARCKEALDLRQQAEDSGLLLAGKLAAETQRQQSRNPVVRLLGNKNAAEVGASSACFKKIIQEMD